LNTNNNINKFYSKIEQVTNILFMDKKATLYLCLDFLGKLKILSSCKCLSYEEHLVLQKYVQNSTIYKKIRK
jgi:hypothetical protein